MRITYAGEGDSAAAQSRGSVPMHLNVVTILVIVLVVIVGIALWFWLYMAPDQKSNTVTTQQAVPLPKELKSRPLDITAGIEQCNSLYAAATTQDNAKRQRCYQAVMIVFGTSLICDNQKLDASGKDLCIKAQQVYVAESAAAQANGTGSGGSAGVATGASSGQNQTGSNGTGTGQKPGGTNPSQKPGGTSTPIPSNPGTQPLNTTTPTSTPITGPSGGSTTTPTSTNPSGYIPPSGPPLPPEPVEECIPATNTPILLQHTNICQ